MTDFDDEPNYAEAILEHYEASSYRGLLADSTIELEGKHPGCADRVVIQLIVDPVGLITRARFDGEGCTIAMAGTSVACEAVEGRTIADVEAMDSTVIAAVIGKDAVASRPGCATLGLSTVKLAARRVITA